MLPKVCSNCAFWALTSAAASTMPDAKSFIYPPNFRKPSIMTSESTFAFRISPKLTACVPASSRLSLVSSSPLLTSASFCSMPLSAVVALSTASLHLRVRASFSPYFAADFCIMSVKVLMRSFCVVICSDRILDFAAAFSSALVVLLKLETVARICASRVLACWMI